MTKDKSDLRIGELLIEAQIMRARELSEAITIAKLTNLPIGRILVMSSYVGEKEFRAALEAQSLVRDAVIPLKSAIQALSIMYRKKISFEQALAEVGCESISSTKTNKLGELLQDAEIITAEQLQMGLATSEATSLPLGRVLISLNCISEETLTTALNAQVFIREEKLTRDQGLRGMTAAYLRRLPIEKRLQEKGFFRGPLRPSMRLGELFVLAKILTQTDVMAALEYALLNEIPLGRALTTRGLLTWPTIDIGLTLQEMLTNRTLSDQQAAQCMVSAYAGSTLAEVLAHLEVPDEQFKAKVRFHELLRVAGMVEHSDIELSDIDASGKPSSSDAIDVADTLYKNGFIDYRKQMGALRCYFLISSGFISIEQALIALSTFNTRDIDFDRVLQELGWTIKTRPVFEDESGFAQNVEQV